MADVRKNTDESRFEIFVDGERAGFATYEVGNLGVIVVPHTEVDDKFQGRGVASDLVRGVLDDIRKEGYQVQPDCPYVQSWIGKHPEYGDLVATKPANVEGDDTADSLSDVTGVDPAEDRRI